MPEPNNISVDNVKPLNIGVDPTSAVFQAQSLEYDQPNTQWDQPNTFWGGSDQRQGGKPLNIRVDKA
jgi:hypothetical protein